MNRQLLCQIAVLLLSAFGCTSNIAKHSRSNPLSLSPLRQLASLTNGEDEKAFTLASSATANDEVAAHLNHYARLYFLAQAYLAEFDLNLKKIVRHPSADAPDIFSKAAPTGPAYARLIATRILRDKISHTLHDAYFGAADLELSTLSGSPSPSQVERAKNFAAVFGRALAASGAQRLALQGVYEDILQTSDQLQAYLVQKTSQTANLNIQKVAGVAAGLALTGKTIGPYAKSHRKDLKLQAEQALHDDEVTKEIEELASGVEEELTSHGRRPQSEEKIHPDPGPAGEITGFEYPAGTWSLSFDDGPSSAHTPVILQNLKDHDLKATFMVVTKMAEVGHREITAEEEAGMTQGDHSFSHARLTAPTTDLHQEIVTSYETLAHMIGPSPGVRFFRCPYGLCGPPGGTIRQMIAAENLIHVRWNVESGDYDDPDPVSILNRVIAEMDYRERVNHTGGIVLFHDIKAQTVQASKLVMDEFNARIEAGRLRSLTTLEGLNLLNGEIRPDSQ